MQVATDILAAAADHEAPSTRRTDDRFSTKATVRDIFVSSVHNIFAMQ
jgi:hypothetical protein